MKEEKLVLYTPLHLKKLSLDIRQYTRKKEEEKRSLLGKLKNIFHTG